MNLIKTKGTLGLQGHTILFVVIGLLVSETSSQAADSPEKELSSPEKELSSPEKELSSPEKELSSPEKELSSPEKELSSPEKELSSPEKELSSPEKELSSPEKELSSLKLKLESLETRYRLLCNQYNEVAHDCSAAPINCNDCPDGWFQVGDQCFFISKGVRLDWVSSKNNCTEKGGHLAILTTKEQHEAIEKESRRIGGFYTDFWIGLTDAENEGEWKWVNNSTLKTPFWNTLKSEPDDNKSSGPEGEDCVVVDSYSQSWFDVPCNFNYLYICQMDNVPPQ